MSASSRGRLRVAVLGGGCAGCAAAHALSKTPSLRSTFEVTVYEGSHRLGGKGATGRDPAAGDAVLEHGLHVWMGWYHHAFAVVRDVLSHWRTSGETRPPFTTIEDAFEPSFTCSFLDPTHPTRPVTLKLPRRPGIPGVAPTRIDQVLSLAALPRVLIEMGSQFLRLDPSTRGLFTKLAAVVARGLLRDLRGMGPEALLALDELDLRAWLAKHGANEDVCNAPPVRAFYDLAFAYPDGVSGPGKGSVAAGAALASMARIFASYRGAPFWRMRAGMGDTVFAPMYEVLRDRGVDFRFFHRVTDLRLDEGRDHAIGRIDMEVSARPRTGNYEPLVELDVGEGRSLPVWPEHPRAELLDSRGSRARSLQLGRDFDVVILAIPAPALPGITAQVRRVSPAFDRMLTHAHGVATRATQVWLQASPAEASFPAKTVMTGSRGLFASWADMTDVLPFERWSRDPQPAPKALLYGCDVDAGDGGPDLDVLRTAAVAELRSKLDPEDAAKAQVRHVYVRRNTQPWEHYCLTLPGTTRFRLGADQSGLSNLLLAGDWTRTSINGGSVEAAFEAGESAAAAAERFSQARR